MFSFDVKLEGGVFLLDCGDGRDLVGAPEGGRAHFAEADVLDFAFSGAGQLVSRTI